MNNRVKANVRVWAISYYVDKTLTVYTVMSTKWYYHDAPVFPNTDQVHILVAIMLKVFSIDCYTAFNDVIISLLTQ